MKINQAAGLSALICRSEPGDSLGSRQRMGQGDSGSSSTNGGAHRQKQAHRSGGPRTGHVPLGRPPPPRPDGHLRTWATAFPSGDLVPRGV